MEDEVEEERGEHRGCLSIHFQYNQLQKSQLKRQL